MMPMPIPFMVHYCGESQKGTLLLWVIFCSLLFAAQFTDAFYSVSPRCSQTMAFRFRSCHSLHSFSVRSTTV